MTDAGFPDLSPEEFAQLTTGPNRFAMDWVCDVLQQQVEPAWNALSAEFRFGSAQMWIYSNPAVISDPWAGGLDRDRLVERLLEARPDDDLSMNMRTVQIRTIARSFGDVRFEDLGMGSRPRPLGPDLELVRLVYTPDLTVDTNGYHQLLPGASARSVSVLVTTVDRGWKVAGVNEHLLRPGWPPTHEQVAGPTD
ncbi:hypothetical protein [Actinophytocola sp.]|uniref:hypothetical protein n=1 Tax=Actinophytocola sp. TaxID=1872138 RepID=UPI0038998325